MRKYFCSLINNEHDKIYENKVENQNNFIILYECFPLAGIFKINCCWFSCL